MSSFTANSQVYNIVTENELAEVLSHYNSEFVFSIVSEGMRSRFSAVPITVMPNVVGAWEQNFKAIIAEYGDTSREEVMRVRNTTYEEIIDTICREFGLNFTIDDGVDLYSAAYHLYNFLVCLFADNLTTFFANFIYRERSAFYDSLGLADMKKNKDSSTVYGKKIYKDIKLAVINANIDMVVSAVCSMDINFHNILSTIFGNNSNMKNYLATIVGDIDGNFFQRAYVAVLNSDVRPDLITNIRFKLQDIAISHDQAITANVNEIIPTAGEPQEVLDAE